MPTGRHLQTSLASGEFDPLLWNREDVSFFYNSARVVENAVPLPQGGAKRREGWRYRGLQRGAISAIDISGATVTTANGGTAASATDGDDQTAFTTTTAIGVTAEYEVIRLDLAAGVDVTMIDFDALRLTSLPTGVESAALALQSSDDAAAWTTLQSLEVGTSAFNRRFAAKPDALLSEARYVRLVVLSGVDLEGATVEFLDLKFWIEAGWSAVDAEPGEFSIHRITSDIENEYHMVLTAGCAEVYRTDTGVWVASIAMPHTDSQVRRIKRAARLDTIIFFHQDVPPWQAQRLGSDADWRSGAVEFDSVVEFPFDDGEVSGGENEIQQFRFDSMAAGNKFVFEYNGEKSDEVVWNATAATNATNMQAAILTLSDISSVTVASDTDVATNTVFTVEFTGEDGEQRWPVLVVDILSGSGTVEVERRQFGRKPFDLLWSETRGYPSCGAFYQGRWWLGGFRSRPDVLVGSRAGAFFEFKEDADPVAGSPIVVSPSIDEQITIHEVYPGRHLQIFTSSAELYVPDEPITVDNIAIRVTSRHGSNEDTQPVDIQGGTMFADRNGRTLREYLFQDAEQNYSAEPISILAGHLMAKPRSIVLRRARDVDEPTLLLLANTGEDRDGNTVPAAMIVIDRVQQVTGFFRVKTKGTPLEFSTSQEGDAFVVTRRELAGNPWNYIEQFDETCLSDAGVKIQGSGSSIDLRGVADHLSDEEVFVHVDGLPAGSYIATDGQIDLGELSYENEVEVGLRMVPRIVLHPYKGRGDTSPTMKNMRIFRALLQLERTGAIAIGMDGGRPRPVSLQNHDSGTMDPTAEEVLLTGQRRVSGIGRWQIEPALEITQIDPMPFLLRSVTYDVRY